MSNATAFWLLLGQKFTSVFIMKVLLFGELPSLRDQQFLALLGIHFLTFCYFHSSLGEPLMRRIRQSQFRIVLQETLKGYGKSINLIGSVRKALKLETNVGYFVMVLIIRGSASALFKARTLSLILKKPMTTKKARRNFYQNTLPSIILYLTRFVLKTHISKESRIYEEIDHVSIVFFVTYMVLSRFMRSLIRVVKRDSIERLSETEIAENFKSESDQNLKE